MEINIREARGLLTKQLATVYQEKPRVFSFGRSFFTAKEYPTALVSVEVQRGTELVAVDILRGQEGNINTFDRSTERMYLPYLFDEKFNSTNLDIYKQIHLPQSGTVDIKQFELWIETLADKVSVLDDKISRAEELMAWQVLEDGILVGNNNNNIDFKRKNTSKVDKGAGNYWATGTVDPRVDLKNGCDWLRANGKAQGEWFDAILGDSAFHDLMNNTKFQSQGDIRAFESFQALKEPMRTSVGGTLHGWISCGSYKVRLWTYTEIYGSNATKYKNPKTVVLLPESPEFFMAYGAVPMLSKELNAITQAAGARHLYEYLDPAKTAHYYGVRSAPIAVPVAIDKIYTVQVVS